MTLDAHPQKVESLVDVDDYRLFLREPKPHREKYRCRLFTQALGVGFGSGHHHDPVVSKTNESIIGQALTPTPFASVRVPHLLPRLGEMFVEDREGDVGEQG